MKKLSYIVCLVLIMVPVVSFGQESDSTRTEVQEDLENALDNFDPDKSGSNAEQITQLLQELAAHPVNVNRAGTNELLRVPGLNLKKAKAIIKFRNDVKPFETIDDLEDVTGIGRVSMERMRPYVTIGSGMELNKSLYTSYNYWTHGGRFQAFSRYQQKVQPGQGYQKTPEEGGYAGSPVQYYQRFGYRSDHISMNLTQQKDAGEQFLGVRRFDHQSWHVAIKNNGGLKMLVAGDYSLAFGQGLVLWNGGVFGKGSNVIGTASRNGRGIHPYTSAQETNYYRGAAATYGDKLQFTGFYSRRRRSATPVSSDTAHFPGTDGYHRTATEIAQKNDLGQTLYGGHVQMELPFGIIGATGYQTTFGHYIQAVDQPYARYDFEGRSNSAFGMDYRLLLGPAILFGEGARSENGGLGGVFGVESPLASNTDMMIAYRNYQKEFQSIYGNGFGEVSGQPKNENGIYLGLRHVIGEKVTLSAYMDQYRFPSPRFGTHQPTQGYDWLGKIEVELSPTLNFYVQLRGETKDEEYEVTDNYGRRQRRLGDAERSSFRANLEYWVNPKIRLRTRGELSRSRKADEQAELGYLIYQDLRLSLNDKLRIDARLTSFDTDSYASRVYQYESDLLYVFSSQALYNTGQRMYVLLNYEPFDFLEFWGKFAITNYVDQQVIGSGLNQVMGNSRSELSFQARVLF